ncbi:MAG: CopG family transcriptional regulator [Thermodesulfobacteriota bacterium]|nr:CopG family transcriptional regulator [Thermodesulfobacteriota bacterium]
MRASTRLENKQNYGAICITYLFLIPKKKKIAKSTEEFDRRFDEGEDIHDLIDMPETRIIRHGKKVRITLDVAEELVNEIDRIRESIGVNRGALIKIWLHERVQQEKVTTT